MCMMASEVSKVENTRIFASANEGRTRQCIVYEMAVELKARTGKGNAMILPVPGSAADIALVDLSGLPGFFEPLDELFRERTKGMRSRGGMDHDDLDELEVHKVGAYDVSIVPTADDVKRLNPEVFELSAATERTLRTQYPLGYAFIVAQIRESGAFHPLGYTHALVGGKLFIPTRHEHGHAVRDGLADWDHTIYHQGSKSLDMVPTDGRYGKARQHKAYERSANMVLGGILGGLTVVAPALAPYIRLDGNLHPVTAEGSLANIDLTVPA